VPQWYWKRGREILLERTADQEIVEGLRKRGHDVRIEEHPNEFGRGQIICRLPGGGYVAGSDGRTDGCAIGY
jgi:gamma-glutamyltranspeptidase/glutathione hydrolase